MSWLDDIRAAALSRCPAILSEWLPGGRTNGYSYQCGDLSGGQGDSLKVNLRTGQWRDWAADVGGGDLIALHAAVRGIEYKAAMLELADRFGIARPERKRKANDWEAITPAPKGSYSSDAQGRVTLPEYPYRDVPACYWAYFDATGDNLLCFRVRFNFADGRKAIKPLTWCRSKSTGEQGWQEKDLPIPRPLYNLPGLAQNPSRILIVEGEKSADAASRLLPDWCVTTWPSGSKAVAQTNWTPVREAMQARIVVWPDRDEAGETAMSRVAELLDRPVEVIATDPRWPKGYDLADLEADAWTTAQVEEWIKEHARTFAQSERVERVEVDVSGRDTLAKVKALFAGLREAGAEMYSSASGPVVLRRNIYGVVETERLDARSFASWAVKWILPLAYSERGRSLAELSEKLCHACVTLAHEHLPVLERACETPIFSNGKLLDDPGYSKEARAFIALPPGYRAGMALEDAWNVVDDLLADFPFETPADRTAAMAFPLTAMLRGSIDGATPLFRFEAPQPRTGKTLLCQVLCELISPYHALATLSRNQEEARKAITSLLLRNPPVAVFDNVEEFESPQLKAALTVNVWQDRILGESRDVNLPVRVLWAVTLNNPILSPELLGRSVRVRLDANMEHPETRDPARFRHKDLLSYVRRERGTLVSALAAIAEIGVGSKAANYPRLGGYEAWIAALAPVLEANSYQDFLKTIEEDQATAGDTTAQAMQEFVAQWADRHGASQVSTSDLADLARNVGGFPGKRKEDGSLSAETVGRTLRKRRGWVVSGYKILYTQTNSGSRWSLAGKNLEYPKPETKDLF